MRRLTTPAHPTPSLSPASMVQIWYLDDSLCKKNHKLPNKTDPARYLTPTQLTEMTGAEHMRFDADTVDTCPKFAAMRQQRGFTYEDVVDISRKGMPDYDNFLATVFSEHIHADDEVRLILSGSGYFDVRDKDDNWVRIETKKNDMVIIPSGLYHRFTLDQHEYAWCKRLFAGSPVWTGYFRPEADTHPARLRFLESRRNL